ncbi:MAG: hypothetical protein IPJ65_07225 [Archangiaceae bacterium]|nr:hypothetical protein [Archangiaceae bacterium]
MSVLAPKGKKLPPPSVQFRPPPELVARLDRARGDLGLSRNAALVQLVSFALDAHEKEQSKKRGGSKEH